MWGINKFVGQLAKGASKLFLSRCFSQQQLLMQKFLKLDCSYKLYFANSIFRFANAFCVCFNTDSLLFLVVLNVTLDV